MAARADLQKINRRKTEHGSTAFFARGGEMKDSKAMEMRHVAAMKKAGVPKKVVAEEKAEAATMKRGGMPKFAKGGGVESRGKTKGKMIAMKRGGKC